ncbi:MAG: hybrid sensor histidine kinase/response regulator [Alphaproteobacteria bacterium]|nr:hybrid sensor histidine kinase/response regulator [Alphaproteobacteria bacterium]OJV16056.1 MAG: hypothetical protein BGO27_04335 [Alphaproteobacteria bacterium 33-17]
MIMLLEWINFIILLIVGIILGYLTYLVNFGTPLIDFDNLNNFIINGTWVILICLAFSFSKSHKNKEKDEWMKTLSLINQDLENKVKERTFQLEQALNIKTQILNNLSHEIRMPIHGANGISQILVDVWDKISDNDKYEYLKKIAKNNARLAKFVNNILDLSKITAGKMQFHYRDINLIDIMTDILEEVEELYLNNKKIEIYHDFKGFKSVLLSGDELRISQLLRNIFNNAVKFTKEGKITVKFEQDLINKLPAIKIIIQDEGIGIPLNEIDNIFEPFIQSSLTDNKAGGTGLGLAISKEIVEAHNGKIWAEHNKPNGAIFNILLPANEITLLNTNSNNLEKHTPQAISKILFIDDEQSSHDLFNLMIYKQSHLKVVHSLNGIEGIEALKNHKIDLILLDLMMPVMNGYEFLKIIRKNPEYAGIPVILQTGVNSTSPEILEIKTLFPDVQVIYKPYEHHILLESIHKTLENAQ